MNADDTGRGKAGRDERGPGSAENPSRSRQDPALKRIFAIKALGADFMLTFKPEYAKRLDLNAMEPHPTELIGPTLDRGQADVVLRVNEKAKPGKPPRLVLLNIELQSRPDRTMPERMVRYDRGLRVSPGGAEASGGVLSLVLYTGRARWTVPVYQEGEQIGEFSATQQPPERYELVDLARSPCDDLDGESVFAVLQRICRAESREEMLERLPALLPELARRSLARGGEAAWVAVREFVVELLRPLQRPEETRPMLEAAKEAETGGGMRGQGMHALQERLTEWTQEWFEEGREEGREEGEHRGRAEGERRARAEQAAMLLRFAVRKFGREATERLAGVVTPDAGSEGLARMGDWIIDCGTLDELLARVENGAPDGQP